MAIVIQQLTNIVNIIDDTLQGGSQIITSIELSSTAQLQLKGGSVPNVLQFFDDEGNQTANVSIAPDLSTQDIGGVPTVWTGTDDELINKMNDVYLTGSGGGGGTASDVTVVGDNVGLAKETKQDDRIEQERLKEPLYILDSNGVPADDDILGNWEFQYFDGSSFVTYTEDLDGTTPADLDDLVNILNTNQNFFVFYNPSENLLPARHDIDLGVRSGTIDIATGFLQSSFLLEFNSGLWGENYTDVGSEPPKSNTDKIVLTLDDLKTGVNLVNSKLNEPCNGSPQNVKDCLTLATPLRYYIQFDSAISTPFDVIGAFDIVYTDNNGIEQTFTDNGDLDSNSPYADTAALITAMNNLSGCPVTFGELTPLDTGNSDFAIEVLDGTVAAANVIEVDGIEVDGVSLDSILKVIYPSLTGFDYVAQQIRNLTTDFNALGTKLDSIDNKLKSNYIGRSFSLVSSTGAAFGGFPFSIERVNIIYNGGVSETVDIEPSGQQLGDIIDAANLLNEYVEGLNFDKFKQSNFNLIFSNGDKIAADILGIELTLTGGASTLQYTTFTSINEDNESELTEARTLLEQLRNNSDADKYNNWTTRVNKSKIIAYYSGVATGNPSGNKNVESITFLDSGNPVLKQTFEYDLQDDVILQGAVKP